MTNSGKITKNPYNRNPIPKNVKRSLKDILRISNIVGDDVIIDIEDDDENICPEKRLELRSLALFQDIDILGNYTDPIWFQSLGRVQLIRFIRELGDIWTYRAQLEISIKRQICPPNGEPFRHINLHALPNMGFESLRLLSLTIMEQLVRGGINDHSRALGANYVLCAITLVNSRAAESLPWLYQAVVHANELI